MVNKKEATTIKRQYEQQWLKLEEVSAIGIGKVKNQAGIIISVTGNPERVRQEIPSEIEGVPITVQQTGKFRVQ